MHIAHRKVSLFWFRENSIVVYFYFVTVAKKRIDKNGI